jgi:hypothetical protein
VTARSIRRDLKALEAAGFEIEHVDVDGERRVRRARTGRTTEPIRLTRYQRYSLAAVRRVFDVLAGTPLHDDFAQLFARLFPSGDEDSGMIERFVYIPEAPKSYRKLKDQIYDIYDGILRTFTLQFQYEKGTTPGRLAQGRALRPGALPERPLRRRPRRAEERPAHLRRRAHAPRAGALQRALQARPGVDVSKMFEGAFGLFYSGERQHVVVDFAPEVAQYIEPREWHPRSGARA